LLKKLLGIKDHRREWEIFAKSFNLYYIRKDHPKIIGSFNGMEIEALVKNVKVNSFARDYSEIKVSHKNPSQQRIKILHRKKFTKLSLLHRIHENLGFSYSNNAFLDDYMLYSYTKLNNNLPERMKADFRKLISHELCVDREKLRYSEPDMIGCHNRLIDLCYFLTELAKEVEMDNFNQAQEVVLYEA